MSQPEGWTVEIVEPVSEWISALDGRNRTRILRAVELLRAYGVQLGMPYARHLRGKLFELRVPVARRDYRVIYLAYAGQRMVLLHGFAKSTQKTPEREMQTAERRLADYLADQAEG